MAKHHMSNSIFCISLNTVTTHNCKVQYTLFPNFSSGVECPRQQGELSCPLVLGLHSIRATSEDQGDAITTAREQKEELTWEFEETKRVKTS